MECAAGKGRPGWRAADADGDPGATLAGLTAEAREVHARFMRLVFELIDGSLDPGQYEDAVRALLGARPLHRLEQSLGFSMSLFAGPGAVRGRRARAARCAAAAPA